MGTEAIVNKDKRRFLIGATSVVGGVGAVAAAVPFVMSLWPSERAKAAGMAENFSQQIRAGLPRMDMAAGTP